MDQTHEFDELPKYVLELIGELMEISGKEYVIGILDGLRDDYNYQWPSRDRPFHLLTLNASMKEYLNHVIALNALKLTRIYRIPSAERVVPKALLEGRLPAEYEAELFSNFGSRPLEVLAKRSRHLYYVMTSQLTTVPIDLRCEHILYDRYPQHRAEQRRFLEREISKLESLVLPDEDQIDVPHVHFASSTINTAYVLEVSDIADSIPPGDTLTGPYLENACDLLERLHAEPLASYLGDCRIVDTWARELGFEGWYAWRPISRRY